MSGRAASSGSRPAHMNRSPNRVIGLVSGLILVALGIAGLFTPADALLFGAFQTNPLQCAIHILLGVTLLATSFIGVSVARRSNAIIGALLLLLGIVGLFTAGTVPNALALNSADNVMHFSLSILLLAVGLGAEQPRSS
jgi:hypothetical protein